MDSHEPGYFLKQRGKVEMISNFAETNRKFLIVAFLLLGLVGGALLMNNNGVFSDTPSRTVSDMLSFTSDARDLMAGASIVERHDDRLTWQIETDLQGNNSYINEGGSGAGAYTVWAAVFNDPGDCHHGADGVACGLGDTQGHSDSTPEGGEHSSSTLDDGFSYSNMSEASVFWAGGGLVGPDRIGQFRGTIEVGETPGGQILRGDGLLNNTAHIHLIVRYHGPAVAGFVDDQIGTLHGFCTSAASPQAGSFDCYEPQVTNHQ